MGDPTPAQRAAQIRLDLEALYRAGRVDFPDQAEEFSGYGSTLGSLMDRAQTQADKASDVHSAVFNDLLGSHYMLYEAVRRCVLTLNDFAEGCIAAADLFTRVDDDAAAAATSLQRELPAIAGGGPAPQAPEPPARDDPTA